MGLGADWWVDTTRHAQNSAWHTQRKYKSIYISCHWDRPWVAGSGTLCSCDWWPPCWGKSGPPSTKLFTARDARPRGEWWPGCRPLQIGQTECLDMGPHPSREWTPFSNLPRTPCPHLCLPLWQSYTCHKSSAQATLCDQKALTRERQRPELLLLTQQLKHDLRGFADHSSLHGCPHLRWLMMSFQDVLHMFSHLSVCLIGIQAPSEMGSVTSSPLDS